MHRYHNRYRDYHLDDIHSATHTVSLKMGGARRITLGWLARGMDPETDSRHLSKLPAPPVREPRRTSSLLGYILLHRMPLR